MKRIPAVITAALVLLFSPATYAVDLVTVNSMNYPAWVDRNDESIALTPGDALQSSDLVRTGEGGRVLLQFSDGSAVKLGESSRFVIKAAAETEDQSLLEASFQVLRGAFRFTSSFFGKATAGHRVDVQIGAITAGVRGTDIWGRNNQEADLVCLLEGEIAVDSEGQATSIMNDPLSFYIKPKGSDPLPIDKVDTSTLQQWAAETELDASRGIASGDGQWQLVMMSLQQDRYLNSTIEKFHQQGFAVQLKSIEIDGRTLHRLVLPGFVSAVAASNAGDTIATGLGITDSWVLPAN